MATIIDWHAHHTAPEIADRIKELTENDRISTPTTPR